MVQRTLLKPILLLALASLSLRAGADLVVLQYHHVSDSTPSSTSTSVSLFNAQMDMISDLELAVVPLESGTQEALASEPGTENRLAITFDDAYDSVYSTAAPVLASKNYPYTIFVKTEAVGRHGYMTWEQLRELGQREGVTLANHSADHGHLARKPAESESQWARRIDQSLDSAQATLREQLDNPAPLFAYPYGEFDSALEAKLADRGWYGYGQQSGAIAQTSDDTRLPRFPMANAYGQLNGLENKLRSKAFPVDASSLPDGVISENPPELAFTLPPSMESSRLTCFASGMGRIDFEVDEGEVTVQAPEAFNSRRFRYNCTYPAGGGRYYWLSQQWLDLTQPED
ncbi:polysaccharide deacetylase family protein [Marinobacter sp. F4206]|uniref:polysaccharide deacetylase family protein n=1 Tax=Marinobacter sp. F4206 TaxID=2861777 RepID=UPI001C5F2447|nr:polysaccharide deacetylase family protein [Marinobacter sp. F4206]MBW4933544.1 polysaccharide deacetylase family protein [Marinobacter sp. F4206]